MNVRDLKPFVGKRVEIVEGNSQKYGKVFQGILSNVDCYSCEITDFAHNGKLYMGNWRMLRTRIVSSVREIQPSDIYGGFLPSEEASVV